MHIFSIDFIILTILNYDLSFVELAGVVSGMLCVYLTAKEKVICWPIGIVNIVFFFIMFYQVRLYSDMILQIIFLIMTAYGWWKWTHPKSKAMANSNDELKITNLTAKELALYLSATFILIVLSGTLMLYIHKILPVIFPEPAAFPYADAFTTILSLTASILMALKKRECWLMWVTVDIVATVVYFMKGINLVAIEYIIFGIIAANGYYTWTKTQKSYNVTADATS